MKRKAKARPKKAAWPNPCSGCIGWEIQLKHAASNMADAIRRCAVLQDTVHDLRTKLAVAPPTAGLMMEAMDHRKIIAALNDGADLREWKRPDRSWAQAAEAFNDAAGRVRLAMNTVAKGP